MNHRKQTRGAPRGALRVLQVRTAVLDGRFGLPAIQLAAWCPRFLTLPLPRPKRVCPQRERGRLPRDLRQHTGGCWSLLRSWLRPHHGISQDKLPDHLGYFQFVHNARRRGKTLLGALVTVLVR